MLRNAYPQPDFARSEWMNLNGKWAFSFDEPNFDLGYEQDIVVPYPWGSPLSDIDESRNATAYYRRFVRFDPAGERIELHFGAVDYECEVRVNGQLVGGHRGGYCPFSFDVTDYWKRSALNEILVKATDMAEKSQTYGKQGYGDARGIWQTVWLESHPKAFIRSFFVKTSLNGTVSYAVETGNCPDGATVRAEFPGVSASAQVVNDHADLTFTVSDPKLWTPECPNLYDGAIVLSANGQEDTVTTYFGIREIGTGVFGKHNRRYITLNGKPYYINGTLDQSFNPQGYFTLPSDEDCKEEILRLKRIGVNMARIHIKAEEPLKLYWADRLGLLIMEDIPCFWGDPTPETRAQFEREMEEEILRDRNHPALFYWVVFNETWGLFDHGKDADGKETKTYTRDTADWVVRCWKRAKELDPTRLVEDNSACNYDHTLTDVNTWHFYLNGYQVVKDHLDQVSGGMTVGSKFNFYDGYAMQDVPCMNSECGNVWGVDGNAGQSDISWQYKYMMNEFRLHDKLCGFVFTEFHDVINEFNGYYTLDNGDKDFGYDRYGMTLRDLHSQDYLGADFAPMTTVRPGETVRVPMFGSSFTDVRHGKTLTVNWTLTVSDPLDGDRQSDSGSYPLVWVGYGAFPAGEIVLTFPHTDGVALLRWTLNDGEEVVMRNGILFDVAAGRADVLTLEPSDFEADDSWRRAFTAQEGNKLNGIGQGTFTATVQTADIPGFASANDLRIAFEASTRPVMTHDLPGYTGDSVGADYMLGYRCDAGANRNSFIQTDRVTDPGEVELLIDGLPVARFNLPDSPADSRGALSHHYQACDRLLDEAGSYGYLCDLRVPSALLLKLREKSSLRLTLRLTSGKGLSLFGRNSGRYGIGFTVRAE